MFKRLLLVAILFALAAPAMAQQLPDAFVRVTAMCDNPDGTYNLRVRYEVDSNNANKPDSGTVTFNLQVGGTAYVTGETIEPGESKFYDVPDTANGIRAVLSGHNNTYGGTASNNNSPCAPPNAFVRVTAMCDNPDDTYNLRVRYEVDGSANKPDSGTVTFNLQVGGTIHVTGETIEPGESLFFDVPDTANGIRAVLSGHTNTYGGTASNNNSPCATTTTSTTTSTTMATTTTTLATTTSSDEVGSGGESTTSTTAPTTSSTDDVDGGTVDTLPFTGPTGGSGLLAISGVALLALGVASLISVRRQGRHEA